MQAADGVWKFEVQVYLADICPDAVRVELYADPLGNEEPVRITMSRDGAIAGAVNSHRYLGAAPSSRPVEHYTPRVVPAHPEARVPLEESHICWFHGA